MRRNANIERRTTKGIRGSTEALPLSRRTRLLYAWFFTEKLGEERLLDPNKVAQEFLTGYHNPTGSGKAREILSEAPVGVC